MSGTTTIVVTDLATSTEQLTATGDDRGAAALTAHLRLVREVVERHSGRVAKTLGDGVMALFNSAYDASRAAMALQQHVERAGRDAHASPQLRIGASVGEVVDASDGASEDVFGAAVVLAHRLCALAEPGQILVADLVAMLVGSRSDVTFQSAGAVRPKGFDNEVAASIVLWERLPDEAPTRVVVADDAALVRSGVVRLLGDEGFVVLGEAADADALIELVDREQPDLVITDIRMPPTHSDEGLRAAAEIRARHPSTAVLVLSQHIEARAASDLLDDHAAGVGYLLKERVADVDEFLAACRLVADGGRVVDPLVAEQLLAAHRADDPVQRLSERERDVLGLMAQGKSNAAIAESLSLSARTVETHVRAIFTKLDLEDNPDEHRRVAAVVHWMQSHR